LIRRLIVLLTIVALATGCTAARAFKQGEEAARLGDWDTAVTHYRRAVQEAPDRPDYKIQLERAMQNAAIDHITRAYDLEEKDQLDPALKEYRKALEYDLTNRIAAAKAAELERQIRERVEASRPKPKIEELREKARQLSPEPILNPARREPLKVVFNNASVRDILNVIGSTAGINVTYDQQAESAVSRGYTVNLEGVTLEEALNQVLTANGLFYKVVNPRTIIVIPDIPAKRAQYEELVIKTFFLSHADATELTTMINQVARLPGVQPAVMANKTANTITIRTTAALAGVIERVIRTNDKPRAEILLEVEILEVSRTRLKQYGINLSAYTVNLFFSPEQPPSAGTGGAISTAPFNLNTISQGISTADFYLAVPTAIVNFLENDANTRILAKPQLRGAEGQKLTLNLGQQVPVLSTVFGAAAAGGFATIPQSSFNYRDVGVNLEMEPRVSYDGEIILTLGLEVSAVGPDREVAGQVVPTFQTRRVSTRLRLREGESNLLAGLIQQNERRAITGLPGLVHVPVFRQLFSGNRIESDDNDIVMLITPHIVRTHELTAEDLAPIFIGTQTNINLGGPPPLIVPSPVPEQAPETTIDPGPGVTQQPGTRQGVPVGPEAGATPGGVPQPSRPGIPPGTPAAPTPGALPQQPPPAVTPAPVPPVPPVPPEPVPVEPAAPPTVPPRDRPAAPPTPEAPAPPPPSAAQIILTTPGTEFRVSGGPYTVPISINNVSRASATTVTLTFNPTVVRARNVQEGSFMRQGGVGTSFTPRIDAAAGRVDVVITRQNDATGGSGSGLLAAVLFDAIAPGSVTFNVTGMATTPEGGTIPLQFSPVTVTVR
jgi:general secretion pathway protein D